MRELRPQIRNCANLIHDEAASAEFVSLMNEADDFHAKATELRRRAWAIFHRRDEEFSSYA
jgi:hypothetical protein